MRLPAVLEKYLFFLVHLKGLFTHGFSKKYYSQWGEDILARNLFPGVKNGFFVDVGAYHPFHYSNTYLLYRAGWSGLNVDPNPWSKPLFKFHRPRDTTLTSGVGQSVTNAMYYIFNHQSCNSFSEAHRDAMLKRPFMRQVGEALVPIAPLSHIMDEHAKGRAIDFLNVDVEGMSLEVLDSLDWKRYAPRVVCVEDDETLLGEVPTQSAVHTFLLAHGYTFYVRAGLSSLYTLHA